ncbi:hypothetical protein GSI_12303 [Ganoderma sinense ZZ0214-1]|uniref:BTB domain-containing protein n=1 Tax=Ganoderma sinense ZZ0214-1 TaxID=1077348 RepID=A0A2G8RYG4_9APHY|nr:hypothetical protein GSI_12303 [Ganoderma sinense ZZ0214-1]
MTHDTPSTKRRRVPSRTKPFVAILAPGESAELAHGQEKFIRHAVDFWLDDGNLILLAGDTAFRVYKGLLTKNSAVFADMFAAGSADATETFDGCPVVRLPDHPKDLRDFLQYLMPCSKLTLCKGRPVSDFAELHAAFHLAHKYQCPDVETRALSVLKRFYTPHFSDYAYFDASKAGLVRPPRNAAIAAVNIARLTETPSMLPFALYEVCTLEDHMVDGYTRRDGSVEHLTTADLKLCLGARGQLAKQTAFYLKGVFEANPGEGCAHTTQCAQARDNMRDEVNINALGDCDIFTGGM